MNVLFLTNLLPYPLDNGGKIKTYTTLQALYNAGYKIDLICFKETEDSLSQEENELLKICNTIHQIKRKLTTAENKKYMMALAVKSLFSKYPLSTYKFISNKMVAYIKSLRNRKYDLVYFDHLPMFVYQNICKQLWPDAKIILDEHNCEATIMKRNAETTSNVIKKKFMEYEAEKVKKFESHALLTADKTIILSNEDYKVLREAVKKDFSYSIIPIGVMDRGMKNKRDNTNNNLNILFVGTLTWQPNNQGLVWFLDNVIPILDKSGAKYHFFIVGKNPSDELKEKTADKKNVTVTGYVESVDEYYDLCDCMVVPLFIGSGQRVKLIEAFSKGLPAISTSVGAEGLEYKDGSTIIIADKSEDFVNAINRMRNVKFRTTIGLEARKEYEKFYSHETVETLLINAIKS